MKAGRGQAALLLIASGLVFGKTLAADEVGYIAALSSGCKTLQLRQGEQVRDVHLLSLVNAGDRLFNDGCPPQSIAKLQYLDGELRELHAGEWPHPVRELKPAPGPVRNVLSRLLDSLKSLQRSNKIRTIATKSRGAGELLIPWAAAGPAAISPERQHLWFYWRGGRAPFRVRISTADDQLLATEDGLRNRRVAIPLASGAEQLLFALESSDGAMASGRIRRLPAADWNRIKGLQSQTASAEQVALDLLAHDPDGLQLEAYQWVVDAGGAGSSANIVQRGLELGSLPGDLKPARH